MNRRAGIIHLEFNGKGVDTKGNWTIHTGWPKREAILGGGGTVLGYKEVLESPPSIKGEMVITPNLDFNELHDSDDVTITLVLGDRLYIMRSSWLSDSEIATEEGTMSVTFQGMGMEITKYDGK